MGFIKRIFGAKAQYYSLTGLESAKKDVNKRLGIQSLILSIVGAVFVIVFVGLAHYVYKICLAHNSVMARQVFLFCH